MSTHSEPDEGTRKVRLFFVLIGILVILIGQTLGYASPLVIDKYPIQMILLSGIGLAIFFVSFYIPVSKSMQARINRIKISRKLVWIVFAIIFSGLSAFSMALFSKSNQKVYLPVLITWFFAGILYLYALRDSSPDIKNIKVWLAAHRTELFVLCGITLLAAILRFYKLGIYPRIIDGDEGLMGLFATTTTSGHYANPFALWENFGALYLQAINFSFEVFGATPFALRLLPALSGTAAIPALYLLARQVAGKRVATISALLLAISHTHIHFSRIASVGYIHGTWLVPLEFFLLIRGLEKKKSWLTAAGGALLAVHFSVYLTSQIIVGLLIVYFLITFLFMRKWFLSITRQVAAFIGGFAIMILPELAYIILNPSEFFNRLAQDGTFQSGWLAQTMQITGQSAFQVLAGRVVHAFLALIYYPATDFYGSNIPMLSIFTAVFFLLGLIIALRKLRSPGMLLINGYFWAPVLAIGIFSIPPSADSYRMLIVLPPALLMAGMAIDEIMELIGVGWERAGKSYALLVGALLLSLAAFNLWAYYGDFVGQCRYGGNLAGRFASYLGKYAQTIDEGSQIYLLSDETYFYGSHASTDFLSGQKNITNVAGPINTMPGVLGDTIIASPARIPELEAWIHDHPGGKTNYVRDCSNIILLGYKIP